MKTAERAPQYPEVFLHSALAAYMSASGWQVREEFSYLTKRFDIVAFNSGVLICIEVKTRDYRKALAQLTTSRLIFHQVFVALASRHMSNNAIAECRNSGAGLIAIGTPPRFEPSTIVPAIWCEERLNPHTQQVLKIAGFKA